MRILASIGHNHFYALEVGTLQCAHLLAVLWPELVNPNCVCWRFKLAMFYRQFVGSCSGVEQQHQQQRQLHQSMHSGTPFQSYLRWGRAFWWDVNWCDWRARYSKNTAALDLHRENTARKREQAWLHQLQLPLCLPVAATAQAEAATDCSDLSTAFRRRVAVCSGLCLSMPLPLRRSILSYALSYQPHWHLCA